MGWPESLIQNLFQKPSTQSVRNRAGKTKGQKTSIHEQKLGHGVLFETVGDEQRDDPSMENVHKQGSLSHDPNGSQDAQTGKAVDAPEKQENQTACRDDVPHGGRVKQFAVAGSGQQRARKVNRQNDASAEENKAQGQDRGG